MNKDYYKKSVHYGFGHTRLKRILSLIPDEKNLSVLDVGCANGRLGGEIKKKGHSVWGVDISTDAIQKAQQVLDGVFEFDIQSTWPGNLLEDNFDVILMSELLEHVFNPVEVLKNATKHLKSGGYIIITTPNFMTWTNRLRFIFGDFNYKDQGMFDFGHIRWFTYSYLKKTLEDSSLEIVEEKHIIFPNKLNFILKYWPSLFAWQFVLKAKKL